MSLYMIMITFWIIHELIYDSSCIASGRHTFEKLVEKENSRALFYLMQLFSTLDSFQLQTPKILDKISSWVTIIFTVKSLWTAFSFNSV